MKKIIIAFATFFVMSFLTASLVLAFFDVLSTETTIHLTIGEWEEEGFIVAYQTGFENVSTVEGNMGSYAFGVIESDGAVWELDNVLRGSQNNDKKVDNFSLRGRAQGKAELISSYQGLKYIEFYFARFGNDSGGVLSVEISTDSGSQWIQVWSEDTTNVGELQKAEITLDYNELNVDKSDHFNVRWVFSGTNNRRTNLDEIKLFVQGGRTITLATENPLAVLTKTPDNETYGHGTNVTIEASEITDYDFLYWINTITNEIFTTNRIFTLSVEKDLDLEAVYFKEENYTSVYYTNFNVVKNSYAPDTLTLNDVEWTFYNALTGTLSSDKTEVGRAARLTINRQNIPNQNNPAYDEHAEYRGFIQPMEVFSDVGMIVFTAAYYGNDTDTEMKLEVSINGNDWVLVDEDFELQEDLQEFRVILDYDLLDGINFGDSIYIRITNDSASSNNSNIRRINIDEFEVFKLEP